MESALQPLVEHLTCQECQETLGDRIQNLVAQWSVVKVYCRHVFLLIPLADVRYSAQSDVRPFQSSHVTRPLQAPSTIQKFQIQAKYIYWGLSFRPHAPEQPTTVSRFLTLFALYHLSHRIYASNMAIPPNMTHAVPASLPFLVFIFLGLGYLTVINHWHNRHTRFDSRIRPCIHVLWGLCNCILTSITSDIAIQINTCSNPD